MASEPITTEDLQSLVSELRDEARQADLLTRPDPDGYGRICDLEADSDLLDRAAEAITQLLESPADTVHIVTAEARIGRGLPGREGAMTIPGTPKE